MHVLVPKSDHPNIRFVLAVINSRLMNWYYHTLNPEIGEVFAEVKKTNVGKLPVVIPPENDGLYRALVALCTQMLDLCERRRGCRVDRERTVFARQIEATDRQIDKLVYELYGLTGSEIEIVESSTTVG